MRSFLIALLATAALPGAALAQVEERDERPTLRAPRTDDRTPQVERPAPPPRPERPAFAADRPAPAAVEVAQRDRGGADRNWGGRRGDGGGQRGDGGGRRDWQRPATPAGITQPDRPTPPSGWQGNADRRGDAARREDRRNGHGADGGRFDRDAAARPDRNRGDRDWTDRDRGDRNRGDWNRRNDRRAGWNDRDRTDWNRNGNQRDGRWDGRYDGRGNNGWNQRDIGRRDFRSWDRGWRTNSRYDWQRYRSGNRYAFRLPRYAAPYGWNRGYTRFSIGATLFGGLYAQDYWIGDPWAYRLPPVYWPYQWVRYYNDALLVDTRSGYVVDVIPDIFWY